MRAAVRMYLAIEPPPAAWGILRERGFRPAKKSSNWYRLFDIRLPGAADELLAAEAMFRERGVTFQIRNVRRVRRPGKTTTPSAASWLSRHKHQGASQGRSA